MKKPLLLILTLTFGFNLFTFGQNANTESYPWQDGMLNGLEANNIISAKKVVQRLAKQSKNLQGEQKKKTQQLIRCIKELYTANQNCRKALKKQDEAKITIEKCHRQAREFMEPNPLTGDVNTIGANNARNKAEKVKWETKRLLEAAGSQMEKALLQADKIANDIYEHSPKDSEMLAKIVGDMANELDGIINNEHNKKNNATAGTRPGSASTKNTPNSFSSHANKRLTEAINNKESKEIIRNLADNLLREGIEENNIHMIRRALKYGADVNGSSLSGQRHICKAVKNCNKAIIDILIQEGAELNCIGSLSETPYFSTDDEQLREYLLKKGCKKPSDIEIAARAAKQLRRVKIIQILDEGLLVEDLNVAGNSPIAFVNMYYVNDISFAEGDFIHFYYGNKGRYQYPTANGAIKTVIQYDAILDTIYHIQYNSQCGTTIQILENGILVAAENPRHDYLTPVFIEIPKNEHSKVDGEKVTFDCVRSGTYSYVDVNGHTRTIPRLIPK